jgi:hypothetical protein
MDTQDERVLVNPIGMMQHGQSLTFQFAQSIGRNRGSRSFGAKNNDPL